LRKVIAIASFVLCMGLLVSSLVIDRQERRRQAHRDLPMQIRSLHACVVVIEPDRNGVYGDDPLWKLERMARGNHVFAGELIEKERLESLIRRCHERYATAYLSLARTSRSYLARMSSLDSLGRHMLRTDLSAEDLGLADREIEVLERLLAR
jgi:hypothetical protein